jgi:Lipoprotein amino terminal region.
LANKLKEATRNQDSLKAQVYIKALGNLGHTAVLAVFKPYLEGKAPATNFQRLSMVAAMDQVARLSPKSVQPALFNIYLNTGESHELRCAAVFQLMKTYPSAQLLQRMAAFTEQDMSKQVNSAVKSAIESAAEQQHPKLQEL